MMKMFSEGCSHICRKGLSLVNLIPLIFVFFLLPLVMQITFCEEIESPTAKISGYVMDALSGKPITNASIIVGSNHLKTDENGFFTLDITSDGWYEIYIFCDLPETEGVDYVPSLWKVYVGKGVSMHKIISLWPGASLEVMGKIRFVEEALPISWVKFTIHPSKGIIWGDEYSIDEYGTIDTSRKLGLDSDLIIVPANIPVSIKVEARTSGKTRKSFVLTPSEAINFVLKQGSKEILDVEKICLEYDFQSVRDSLGRALGLVYEAKNSGFLVEREKISIEKAFLSLDYFETLISKRSYDEAFALLRNIYLLTANVRQEIADLLTKSSQTPFLSIFLISLMSLILSHLFADKRTSLKFSSFRKWAFLLPLRPVIALLFYFLFLLLFILCFPGCRFLSPTLLTSFSLLSPCFALILVRGSQKILEGERRKEKSISIGGLIIAAFSIALGNLKRRKLRSWLNIICITMVIFCFIVFTSISPGYGFISKPLGSSKLNLNIMMIAGVEDAIGYGFSTLNEDLLEELEKNTDIVIIAPKAENLPSSSPIGYLYSFSGKSKALYGLLGILPKSEAIVSRLNESLVEGNYLDDEDEEGLLISRSLAEYLGVKTQDKVSFLEKTFTIVGIFNDEKIDRSMEMNGRSFLPYRLQPTPGGIYVTQCWSDEIVIMNFRAALKLPNVGISRVYVQLKNSSNLLKMADTIVLARNCVAWVSFEGQLYKKYIGSYIEKKGLSLIPFVMFLVILIIGSMMFRSVEERKRDIFTLSSVGLNPTHIVSLFLAEALLIGFTAGILGYLLGVSGYRFVSLISPLEVKEKASIEWSLISLFLSLLTSIIATLPPAVKASTIVTPSRLRKLRLIEKERPKREGEPWIIELPAKVKPGEINFFCKYVERKLKELTSSLIERIEKIEFSKEEEQGEYLRRKISFEYVGGETKRQLRSFNEIIIERKTSEDFYRVYLLSFPERNLEETVIKTAALIRRIILEWNVLKPVLIVPEPTIVQLYSLTRFFNPKLIYVISSEKDFSGKIKELERLLEKDGISLPQMSLIYIDLSEPINDSIKKLEKIVPETDIVCISGTSAMACAALTIVAMKSKKPICYIIPKFNLELQEIVFLD